MQRTVGRPVIGHAALREQRKAVEELVHLDGRLVDRQHHGALPVGEPVWWWWCFGGGTGWWLVVVCVHGTWTTAEAFATAAMPATAAATAYVRTPARRASARAPCCYQGPWWARRGKEGRGGRSPVFFCSIHILVVNKVCSILWLLVAAAVRAVSLSRHLYR